MAIFKPFSQREKERLGEVSDVYRYDDIPRTLRNQITKTWERFFGKSRYSTGNGTFPNSGWRQLRSDIAEYVGMRTIRDRAMDDKEAVCEWFSEVLDSEPAIDVLDISVNVMLKFNGSEEKKIYWKAEIPVSDAVDEINMRLRQHSIGYEFISGKPPKLIRKDNEHLHKEVIIPTLVLLHDERFKGANEEYRKAHEHYRHYRYRECIADCQSAFESTMKTICDRRKWTYAPTDTAKGLVRVCVENGLLPSFLESHLSTIRTALGDGAPVVRNKLGPHGQGETVKEVPARFAEFMLHEVATIIVLMVEAFKDLPPLV